MAEQKVASGMAISMDYTLTVEGEVLDSSKENGPIEFLQGHGNIIPGLEEEIEGMAVGQSKKTTIAAKNGYGETNPAEIKDVSKEEFPDEIPMEPGVDLEMNDEDGHVVHGTILEVGKDTVKMDFNHPLAGKELNFEIKIVTIRDATSEELAHGHIHAAGHSH